MEGETKLHRRSSSANDVAHYRIPFVHRLSSFRRNRAQAKSVDDLVSTELILKISILQARHLNKDDESNIPNPYVTVRCGGIRQRTDMRRKTFDPEWLCDLEINLTSDIMNQKKRRRALKKHGLCLAVYSKDKFSSIFLGQCSWQLDQLFTDDQASWAFEDNEPTWYPLHQHQPRAFYRRRKREDSNDQLHPEICVRYGLILKSVQGTDVPQNPAALKEEWQYLIDDNNDITEDELILPEDKQVLSPPSIASSPTIKPSSSTSTFSHRFKKSSIKKNPSLPCVPNLEPNIMTQKRRRPRRLRSRLIRRGKPQGYYAKFDSDIMGITFLEIESAKDLPPEKNLTRTGFDMDPFVIVSYGSSTFRTRAIRHNLNPVWNEKLYFHVRNTQGNYKIKFAVYDKDKFSNHDFVASQELSIAEIIQKTTAHLSDQMAQVDLATAESPSEAIEDQMGRLTIPLNLAKPDKWKDSCHPTLSIRAKFVPYMEIRKMFWVALAKTCDASNSNTLSRLEVQTMLETLGSNISEATLDQFWKQHNKDVSDELTLDELVQSLEWFMKMVDKDDIVITEEQDKDVPVDVTRHPPKNPFFLADDDDDDDDDEDEEEEDDDEDDGIEDIMEDDDDEEEEDSEYFTGGDDLDDDDSSSTTPSPDEADYEALKEGEGIQYVNGPLKSLELNKEETAPVHKAHEKIIRLNECPICHKPNLAKRGQMDIVTHVATCAANDWTTVDRFLMGNFGSEAQAQRKWFVKLVNKVGYGRYSAGTVSHKHIAWIP
ncbi:hypothetical protein RMCBS344292_16417 [Rhizopus microsporus]|nr:hypothetical protein RMCBS344292_16417 [Rhizopus microsporus]